MIPDHLMVLGTDGLGYRVELGDKGRIDTAVTIWQIEGRDSIVYMSGISGAEIVMLASRIEGWQTSTMASRQEHHRIEQAIKDEEPAEWERETE